MIFRRRTTKERIELGLARLIERDLKHNIKGFQLQSIDTRMEWPTSILSFQVNGFIVRRAAEEK